MTVPRVAALLTLMGLAGCTEEAIGSAGQPLTATLPGGEVFSGTLPPATGEGRAFAMESANGPTCSGQTARLAAGGARATFTCSDGRAGSFPAAGLGPVTGTLGGQALGVVIG